MAFKLRARFRQNAVLWISALCALGTMVLVPPDRQYLTYPDLRVLCLLFCLMAVVEGFRACGAFQALASALLGRCRSGRSLALVLVLLPFFSAMLVTNDVALLTFVPFTLLLLDQLDCARAGIPLLVLQTIAANLGSMATPVGNPQNLYLCSAYSLSPKDFFPVVIPFVLVSMVLLALCALPVLPPTLPVPQTGQRLTSPRLLLWYSLLFLLCLLTVFRAVPFGLTTLVVVLAMAGLDRSVLRRVDYGLLATFLCFFVVSGNLGRVPEVQSLLQGLMGRSPLLTAAAASQVISNVPAAVLLSRFTDQWQPLLLGVDLGGLGTPIASLASLITLKLYLAHPGARAIPFLLVFTAANVLGLVLLLGAALL